uniref:Basement membrane proteoglycan n=1 Tax=Anisakis simplex TaxID=6269 RepID=A0A0M3J4K7_ANISI
LCSIAFTASGPLLVSEEETVNEGDYARLRCYSPGVDDSELHWRREDGREMSEGTTDEHGILTIAQASPSDAGVYLCSMRDPSGYEVDSLPARITVNSVARTLHCIPERLCLKRLLYTSSWLFIADAPIVEPSSVSVIVEHPVRIRCYVRTNPRAELHWRKQGSDEDMQGYLSITKSQFSDSGVYVCAAKSSPHGSAVESPPVQLTVNPIARTFPREPVVNPPQQTIDEGSSARFQCYVPGDPSAQISWHRQDGAPLGADVSESNGMLTITNAQASDAGAYVCHAQQAHTTQPALSSPVYLNVNPQQCTFRAYLMQSFNIS